jgi:hypothetical protein
MRHSARLGLFVAASVLIGVTSAFAQHWGRPSTPSSGACFYRDINFGGDYFCERVGSNSSRVPSGTNDEISSIRVFGNAEVVVYKDGNFHGDSRRFSGNVNDLRRSGWNDKITSYRIESRGFGSGGGHYNGRPVSYPEAQAIVRRAYLAVLEREPDPASSGYVDMVMKQGWTQQRLESELRKSPEYREKHRRK